MPPCRRRPRTNCSRSVSRSSALVSLRRERLHVRLSWLDSRLSITDSSVACRPGQPPGSQGGIKVLGSSVRVLLPGRCPNGQELVAYLDHTRLSSLPSPVRPTRPRRSVRRYSVLGRLL